MNETVQVATGAPAPAVGQTTGGQEFLSFTPGTEEYCIDILKVREIRSYERSTVIADVPEFIKGVVNLRGTILPLACSSSSGRPRSTNACRS